MKPSCESSADSLELPVDDFRALPPLVSMDRMLKKCRQLREWFPQGVPTEEDRLRTKVDVEFVF